jgi:hypothetical protein
MKWSSQNAIAGMDCTAVTESADKHGGWENNFICLPTRGAIHQFSRMILNLDS